MKTIKIIVVGLMMILAGSSQAQVSVRLNIGTPPQWGPSGYDNARYYYLPDIECYYDVPHSMFIYSSGNRWVHSRYLPARYRNYDLYNGYKVVMNDYRGNTPYYQFREHRRRYARGYRGHEQRNIGQRRDDHGRRYEGNRGFNRAPQRNFNQNDRRNQYQGNNRGHDNGNHYGRGNDRGHDQGNNNGRGNGNGKEKGHNDHHD